MSYLSRSPVNNLAPKPYDRNTSVYAIVYTKMPGKEEHPRMKIKFTTLAENTASYMGLLGEWGWSILIEVENTRILLDTGGPRRYRSLQRS